MCLPFGGTVPALHDRLLQKTGLGWPAPGCGPVRQMQGVEPASRLQLQSWRLLVIITWIQNPISCRFFCTYKRSLLSWLFQYDQLESLSSVNWTVECSSGTGALSVGDAHGRKARDSAPNLSVVRNWASDRTQSQDLLGTGAGQGAAPGAKAQGMPGALGLVLPGGP